MKTDSGFPDSLCPDFRNPGRRFAHTSKKRL